MVSQGNSETSERLQRRASKIVSSETVLSLLVDGSYCIRHVNLILGNSVVSDCIVDRVPVHLQTLQLKRNSDIHNYEARNRLLLYVDKGFDYSQQNVLFFYKRAVIFNDTL